MGFWKGKAMFVLAGILISIGLFFADFVETAYAYTTVGSSITSDTVWTKENSPYVIQGPVYIPPSATLTVNPGAVVKFKDDGYGNRGALNVDGILKADATPEDPIYFTSIYDDTVGGDTNGDGSASLPGVGNSGNWIKLNNATSPSTFDNVYIKYNNYGLWIGNGSHQITNTHLIKNSYCIYMESGNVEVNKAEIADNSTGVYIGNGSAIIKNSSIHNNIQGLYVSFASDLKVDAKNNWWGNASGPHHTVFNVAGTGDKIGGDSFNAFIPWLTSEPTQQPENDLPINIINIAAIFPAEKIIYNPLMLPSYVNLYYSLDYTADSEYFKESDEVVSSSELPFSLVNAQGSVNINSGFVFKTYFVQDKYKAILKFEAPFYSDVQNYSLNIGSLSSLLSSC